MSLRTKILLFTIAFFSMALILSTGAYYIYSNFGRTIDDFHTEANRNLLHEELSHQIREMADNSERWVLTADPVYISQYKESVSSLEKIFGQIQETKSLPDEFFQDITRLKDKAGELISIKSPSYDDDTEQKIYLMRLNADLVDDALVLQHRSYVQSMESILQDGEIMAKNMAYYLSVMVLFALGFSILLVVMMRRILSEPYKEMMTATEHIASGDFGYRISSQRRDELGVISGRFDKMAANLELSNLNMQRKLRETELLLSVAKMAGMIPELKGALKPIAEIISELMGEDVCFIFLYRPTLKQFTLESSNIDNVPEDVFLGVDSPVASTIVSTLLPLHIASPEDSVDIQSMFPSLDMKTWLIVPIVRDNSCVGLIILGSSRERTFEQDEIDTSVIVSHTIGAAVKNLELYDETKRQLKQLSTVYELSKALTSVFEPEEILDTITSKISQLITARGCIIRLLEDDNRLVIKSFIGPQEEMGSELSVPVGVGIAGWVAQEGHPLLVENVANLPEGIRAPSITSKSAISVPLKKGDKIIGTLGLYDKLDDRGNPVTFTLDDLALAEGFASISAIAIEKARMQEEKTVIEAHAQESRKRMELLFESVQGGIITLDRDYTITTANKYVERWIDLPLEEIINRSAIDVFHEKGGICPHCAAKVTFDEGSFNAITQSSGLNYADLSAYPILNEAGAVSEVVVFIQDITDRVLYQEEIMGLYKEVMQTKEYMESLINNSADAIVTSDIDGTVKSWNPAAETIYGFSKDESIGKFLPFIPDSLMTIEQQHIEKIKGGEVLKLETFRKKKDSTLIEVSLTLSPIKDLSGEIIGISGISRDITDKKRVEKELIRRNQELSRLFFISSAMRSTLELDKLLRMVLTAVTMSDGLGFNRAILFLRDDETGNLKGSMGTGPGGPEEAGKIWEQLSAGRLTLPEIMREIEEQPTVKETPLDIIARQITIDLSSRAPMVEAMLQKQPYSVQDVAKEAPDDLSLFNGLKTDAFSAVPLVARDEMVGLLWVDNHFNRKPITGEDMKFLMGFADQVASAISAARLFQKVSLAEAELENIFRSITDMVFFTDKNYTIQNVNQAVEKKVGLEKEDIIGKKCYEIFHGMDEPWHQCPHHTTMETMQPTVKEVEDPHLDGAYITSTAPMFNTEEVFMGTVHVVRDITEINKLRKKLQSSERMAALGEVAAKVAHEIRNPLVSVGGFAHRLKKRLDGDLKEYATIISDEVGRLETILRDILSFVKEVRMNRADVDFNDLVSNVLGLLDHDIRDKKNVLVRELSQSPLNMYIDPDRIKEVIYNILMNSNQATESGTITVRTSIKDEHGVLEISDTGHGIRTEDIGRIFDPFYTTRPSGTGLGLAICKRIVEENEGFIQVESKGVGQGTRFDIYLPLKED